MRRLSLRQKNVLLSVHVVTAGLWLGTAFCLVAVAIAQHNNPSGDQRYAINTVLKFMDDWIIIPTAVLSLATGGLLCWLTIWGFAKHYWVIVKWAATLVLITTGTIWLGPWLNTMTAIAAVERPDMLPNSLYRFDQQGVIYGGMAQAACLMSLIAISVIKPWGRRTAAPLPADSP